MSPAQALLPAAAAAALALAGAAGLGAALRARAALGSRELPPYRPPAAAAQLPLAALRKQGRTLYFKSCAHCHGLDLTGDEGPDLHGLEISDRRIATVIQRGIKGEMPSFAKKHSEMEVAALVAFVRSVQ